MCDMPDMMEDMQQMQDRLDANDAKIQAIMDYLKMALQYQPENYKVVKPQEVGLVPSMGR